MVDNKELRYVRATAGFFVGKRGVVNPGEIVEISLGEAKDVIVANRGVFATPAEVAAGPMADFKPKDAAGNVIPPDTRTRAQVHAAMRAQAQAQSPGRRGVA